jgi:outer membrane protein OmpA-like peptidoglycan-associated protein
MITGMGAIRGAARESIAGRVTPSVRDSGRALENDTVVSLKRFFFDPAKSELSPEEKASLRHLAEHFRSRNEIVFELRGYTDGAETVPGFDLSQRRAEAVASFLSANGIPFESIHVIGLGEIDGGAANHAEHRRVDLRVFVPAPDDPRWKQLNAPDSEAFR